jgi:hypothetical protein
VPREGVERLVVVVVGVDRSGVMRISPLEEERLGVAVEPGVEHLGREVELARLVEAALEREHRIVRGEQDAVLPRVDM